MLYALIKKSATLSPIFLPIFSILYRNGGRGIHEALLNGLGAESAAKFETVPSRGDEGKSTRRK